MPSYPACGSEGHACSHTLRPLGCHGFFRYFHEQLFWRLVWDMEWNYVYKSHAEEATILVKNSMSGANSHAFPHTLRCIWPVKENCISRRQKQLVLSSRSKTGMWWLTLGWTKCNQSVFSRRSANSVLGYITWGKMICAGTEAVNANITRLLQSSHFPSDLYGFLVNFSAMWTMPIGVQGYNWEDSLVLAWWIWDKSLRTLSGLAETDSDLRAPFLIQKAIKCGLFTYKLMLDA